LDELVSLYPNAQWWIKGDGTDIVKSLCQPVSGQWSGNVDLNDGELQRQYMEFSQRIDKINALRIVQKSAEKIGSELRLVSGTVKRTYGLSHQVIIRRIYSLNICAFFQNF